MNHLYGFAIVLSAAACGGADAHPQDATSASGSTSDIATTNTTAATPVVTPDPAPMSTTTTTGATTPTRTPAATTTTPTTPAPTVERNRGVDDQTMDADNTKINDRDRHGALTAIDHGSSSSETTITATIRKMVMGDSSLSFGAKNVKIITTGTKVTLRGPVSSAQERATIEAHARQTPGVTDIDNQLEVKK